jgi:hypothetical protein
MHTLRFIAALLSSALCALTLSVGAALAEGQGAAEPAAAKPGAKPRPAAAGLCFLHAGD